MKGWYTPFKGLYGKMNAWPCCTYTKTISCTFPICVTFSIHLYIVTYNCMPGSECMLCLSNACCCFVLLLFLPKKVGWVHIGQL